MFTILSSISRVFILSFRATKVILTNTSTVNNQIIIITFSFVANMINSFIYLLIKKLYCQLQLPRPCCYAVEIKHQGNTFFKPSSIFVSFFSKTLGFDDITIFKCFIVIFSLKKENYPIFAFVKSLFSTKKSSKVVNLPLTDETLCLSFWRHKQEKWLLQFSNSLAKSYTLFWKHS